MEDDEEASIMNNLLGKKKNFTEDVEQKNFKNDEIQSEKESHINTKSNKLKEFKESEYKLERFLKSILSEYLNIIKDDLNKKLKKCKGFKTKQFIIPNYKLCQGKLDISNGKIILNKKIIDIFVDFGNKGIKLKNHNKDLRDEIYAKKDFPSTKEEIELNNYLEMIVKEAFKEIYDDEPYELQYLRIKYKDWNEKIKDETKKKKGFYLLYDYGLIKYYEMNQKLFKTVIDKGKILIQKCNLKQYPDFKETTDRLILFCPAGKYPKNRDVRKNIDLKSKTVRQLITEGNDKNLIKNKNLIDKIYNIKDFPETEELKKIKEFLEMTISEAIKLFYNDNDDIYL